MPDEDPAVPPSDLDRGATDVPDAGAGDDAAVDLAAGDDPALDNLEDATPHHTSHHGGGS